MLALLLSTTSVLADEPAWRPLTEDGGRSSPNFYQADADYGTRLAQALQVELEDIQALIPTRTVAR